MDRYLLKNIIIVILALVNLFLLASLVMRETMEQSAERRAEQQMVELFAADGMTLREDAVSHDAPLPSMVLARDAARERAAAVFFLGENLQKEDQGGGTYAYTGNSGVALFREDGSFDVAGKLSLENGEELCREFCKTFSFDEPAFELDANGSGTAAAVYRHEKYAVFNCSVILHLEQGRILTVSGTLLPETSVESGADQSLFSAFAALTAFQNMRRETGAVVSEITEVAPCYRLQSSSSAPMALLPHWCIVTDTSLYYVNALTGAVTAG